ncbi:unnamed protein product [Kluyveromyces dobzhanskii CBS 2104]|uniref:WGS project CCBQ000000000 data, contig 00107 n=1 Tax=Kluyveromyces dobzhanskii CBS 2104 TaxID=1427455 RepID=A0A0A8KYW2_9SACH|nr:unnamed protein product [Kluyveromyces dobzhanskii CBS 2104]
MITYAAFTLLAAIWLWYRLFQFLHIPVFKIVGLLNIELPQSTKVSVDKITQRTITLHWENEPDCIYSGNGPEESHHRYKVLSYKLYLNGKLVGNFPNTKRTYTCISLQGLESGQQYQIDLVTVNQLGFTNKLPNVFVMTLPAETILSADSCSPQDLPEEAQVVEDITQLIPAGVKWRKPLLITQSSKTITPSYSSLTTLNDLEGFSIQDLKSILVCSQEDLHDVLQQHSMALQDFDDTKLQLQMELDNLKVQWNHEIELKKSTKSTINSLESSKVLYDLKREKLERSIKQLEAKMAKMNTDMDSWVNPEDVEKKKSSLKCRYEKLLNDLNENISSTSEQLQSLQKVITEQEDENKKLNQLKKLIENEQASSQTNQVQTSETSTINWAQVMKKISDSTNLSSGLLSASGDDLLSSLPPQSQLVQTIRSEVDTDCKLDDQWKVSKNVFNKRIDQLEKVWKDLQTENNQLKNEVALQTYSMYQQSSQSGLNNDLAGQNQVPPHQLQLHDPSSYSNYSTTGSLLAQTVASAPFSSWLQQEQQQQHHMNQSQIGPLQDHTQSPPLSNHEEFYQNTEYEDSSHLISALENMVSDVGDKPRTTLSFTNDQLDDYWNSSSQVPRPFSPSSQQHHLNQQHVSQPQLSQNVGSIGSSQSSLSGAPPFKQSDRNILGVLNEPQNDDVISFHSALNNGPASSPMVIPSKSMHSVPDTAFSPSFHSIWNDNPVDSSNSSHHGRTDSQQKSWIFNQPPEIPDESAAERPKESSTRRMSKLFARGTQLFKLPSHDSQGS